MNTVRLISFILVYFTLTCLKAFSIGLNFKYYKVENGLSSNTVYVGLQDSDGFMWFGTENGLNKFDGYQFTIFRNIPRDETSLINNIVYCLIEDTDQILWVGTEQGVCSFNLKNNTFNPFTSKTSDEISISGRIQSFILDKSQLWIASTRQGVFIYENNSLLLHDFDEFRSLKSESIWVNTIYKDKENTIWASVDNTIHQIYKFDRHSRKFVPAFPFMKRESQKELRSYSMLEMTDGTLWFGTWTNGLIAVDKNKGSIKERYLNTPGKDKILHIHQMTEYDPNTILIGSNDGLTSFRISSNEGNHAEQHFQEPTLSNRFVYPIYKDREGGLWIGTYHGGINYASPNRNYFTKYTHIEYENSITGNVVSSFCEDNLGNMWIGTEDGGLNCLDIKTDQFTHYGSKNELSFNNINTLYVIDNNLWIGTYSGGLNVMDLYTKKIKHYYSDINDVNSLDDNSIYSVYRDFAGTIWIGTTTGINIYNPKTNNFTRIRNLNDMVLDIEQIGNQIWFATPNRGLQRYDTISKEWKEYKFDVNDKKSLISNNVISLCVDDKKQLWVGTSHGLCKYDINNDCFIDEKVEFQSNYICKILPENNNLWITTLKGLVCYTPSTKHYRHFTVSDGLLSDLFTANSGFKSSSGRIYIGTPSGFNAFYPKQLSENKHIPAVKIIDFQLFNKKIDLNNFLSINKQNTSFLELSHKENSFSFEFTALSFFAPEKNSYSFILEGFDKNWNNAGRERKATYTNIPPGHYVFKVLASNNDGVWNKNGYTLNIVVKPPFWWNIWSISLYILMLIVGIIYLFSYLLKQDKRKNEKKIAKIKSDQEKEASASKIEFFINIAHEIRTPLSLIIAPLEQLIKKYDNMPIDVKENLNIMESNSERLLALVNQLLDFSKIEKSGVQVSLSNQNIYLLLLNIFKRFKPSISFKNINFEYIFDDTEFESFTDGENLTKIVSNLLSNAFKYTTDQIILELNSHANEDYFEISVTDNGIGIPESEISKIFNPFYQITEQHKSGTGIGLYMAKSITLALKGDINIINDPGKRFSILIKLPKIQLEEKKDEDESYSQLILNTNSPTEEKDFCEDFDSHIDNKKSLLIVEDNADMRSFIRKQFSDEYTVYTANDGMEGIAVLESNEVDIIVTDMMMPNMDGIEFCNIIKNNFLWSHIPIIMLTAKTNIESKVEAFEIGADAYLEKPFYVSYLSARIRNLLETRKLLFKKFTQTPYASLKGIAANKLDEEFLIKMNEVIEKNIENPDFLIDDLAQEMGISNSGLFVKIKQISGTTPNKLIQSMRLKKAAELLSEGKYRVNEVCYLVGFNNPSYFTKCFQKHFGKLPKDYE